MNRVAICQPTVILGGRLRVILGIVEVLNEAGIVPDILAARIRFDPAQVVEWYGRPIRAHFRLLPGVPRLPVDTLTVLFNISLWWYGRSYALLINTGNSLLFLPRSQNVLTYMFFPRKARLITPDVSIHLPGKRLPLWSRHRLQRLILRPLYHLSKPDPKHTIVCMTRFTREALRAVYDLPSDLPVVYPPVEIDRFRASPHARPLSVITLGRFTPDKRQLEQIQIAERVPHIPFHIVGFAGNNPYYQNCRRYIEEHDVRNVHLRPDLPFAEMLPLLQSARYFLHTTINEPFGITTVQAIAAGCLPVVHDSGGQREIVIEAALRYRSFQEVPAVLSELERMGESERCSLVRRLQEHVVANFDEKIFAKRMRAILLRYLEEEQCLRD
ncbi:MAG TPA: glycosyltransferase [Chloroflexi bacterium]|nr:glycosyltransferase [Chloroflexota bacterium]